MVKQGHYAGVQSNKKKRSFKQRHQQTQNNLVSRNDIADFLQGRYVLTQQGTSKVVDETMQRFLSEWLVQATTSTENVWQIDKVTQQTLAQIANQVPWQFYAIVAKQWSKLKRFLIKELPAVPTAAAIRVDNQNFNLTPLISKQLAVNWYLTRFGTVSQLATVTTTDIEQVANSFVTDDQIAWQNVAVVYSTTPFVVNASDEQVKQWLIALNDLKIE